MKKLLFLLSLSILFGASLCDHSEDHDDADCSPEDLALLNSCFKYTTRLDCTNDPRGVCNWCHVDALDPNQCQVSDGFCECPKASFLNCYPNNLNCRIFGGMVFRDSIPCYNASITFREDKCPVSGNTASLVPSLVAIVVSLLCLAL